MFGGLEPLCSRYLGLRLLGRTLHGDGMQGGRLGLLCRLHERKLLRLS